MLKLERHIIGAIALVGLLALGAAGCGKKSSKGKAQTSTAAWFNKPLKAVQGKLGKSSFTVKLPDGLSPAKKSEYTYKWWPAGKSEFDYPGFEISTATGFIRTDSAKVVRAGLEKDKDNKVLKCVAVDGGDPGAHRGQGDQKRDGSLLSQGGQGHDGLSGVLAPQLRRSGDCQAGQAR